MDSSSASSWAGFGRAQRASLLRAGFSSRLLGDVEVVLASRSGAKPSTSAFTNEELSALWDAGLTRAQLCAVSGLRESTLAERIWRHRPKGLFAPRSEDCYMPRFSERQVVALAKRWQSGAPLPGWADAAGVSLGVAQRLLAKFQREFPRLFPRRRVQE